MTDPSDKTKWRHTASTKVRDLANDAELELPSHREAQTQARRHHAAVASTDPAIPPSATVASAPSNKWSAPVVDEHEDAATSDTKGIDHNFFSS